MINFKAHRLNYVNINEHHNGIKTPCKVSFVELDTKSANDMKTMRLLSDNWTGIDELSFAKDIYKEANAFKSKKNKHKFYAITRQLSDFSDMRPDLILGIMEVEKLSYDKIEIAYLQNHPLNEYSVSTRQYSHIGTQMINSLIKINKTKDILVNALSEAIPFYKKMGFKAVNMCTLILSKRRWLF